MIDMAVRDLIPSWETENASCAGKPGDEAVGFRGFVRFGVGGLAGWKVWGFDAWLSCGVGRMGLSDLGAGFSWGEDMKQRMVFIDAPKLYDCESAGFEKLCS